MTTLYIILGIVAAIVAVIGLLAFLDRDTRTPEERAAQEKARAKERADRLQALASEHPALLDEAIAEIEAHRIEFIRYLLSNEYALEELKAVKAANDGGAME